MNILRKFQNCLNLVVPRELEKNEFFFQETYHCQNFRSETLKSPLLKILSVSHSGNSEETMTSRFPQKSFADSRLQHKREEKKENEPVFFRKLVLSKAK